MVLLWIAPLLLVVPNVALDATETYTWLEKAVNVLLPLGVYYILCALWSRVGSTVTLLLPVMVLAAFQIVLLFLYGESIIAIDMFLNVATTSVGEAGELLRNLGTAIIVVCALYLPLLVAGIVLWIKGAKLAWADRKAAFWLGSVLTVVGLACAVSALATEKGYAPGRKLFPVNVVSNMGEAIGRTRLTEEYFDNAATFSHHAASRRDAAKPEIYVFVIGETSRAGNWHLNGYERDTNPRLTHRRGLISCSKALSESNTTHKSVPLMLSHLSAAEFADSIYRSKGVIEAFNEAGYSTGFFSNQRRNHSLIDFFGDEADDARFITDDGAEHHDGELCGLLRDFLGRDVGVPKRFVVLHTYGSHFNYKARYPESYNYFTPDDSSVASEENRGQLVNAYDNAIRYTDAVLDSLIATVASTGLPAALVYVADHGEDIYDDERHRFLHASPTPTYWQLHVPMLVWMSDSYRAEHPEKYAAMLANSGKNISSSRSVFHTLLSLADIDTPCYDSSAALTETTYREPQRIYLNDYNEAVPLAESGLRGSDMAALRHARISY